MGVFLRRACSAHYEAGLSAPVRNGCDSACRLRGRRLATKDVAFRSCITAAAKNDISTDHNGDRALALCQITPEGAKADCLKARADYLKQF
jgi:hypothetical protein